MSSAAQFAANQANAQRSTGPQTEEGKAASSLNALKTGLTGHTVLLPSDDADRYEAHLLHHVETLAPVGPDEIALVQTIVDTQWRLARIPSLEDSIFALARVEFADKFNDHPVASRPTLIQGYTYVAYNRQFNNLSIQESRLNRQLVKAVAALADLQTKRREFESMRLHQAARLSLTAKRNNLAFDPAEFGFEFSIDEINQIAFVMEAAGDPLTGIPSF